jgi:two-component system CheB/CheR fusion protein
MTAFADPETFSIVGLGASAGGIEALVTFFSHLGSTPNAAYIILQHRTPDTPIQEFADLIARHSPMPVQVIEEGLTLAAGRVYICPPRTILELEAGAFRCSTTDEEAAIIDPFFQSLAANVGQRAVGILLSGTGEDGVKGLQDIARQGGCTLVQSPETTQFSTMPAQAISSGHVDEILSVPELAQAVANLSEFPSGSVVPSRDGQMQVSPSQLQQIIKILGQRSATDFSNYKTGTLSRRILHRCSLTKVADLDEYLDWLASSEEEQDRLLQDMLIGATQFFRNPQAWQVLETRVLPQLLLQILPQDPLRMWVPACATGEEAYTLAMLVQEALEKLQLSMPVKIFATDLDTQALQVVSQGIYPESIAEELTPTRLQKHFDYNSGQYQVKPYLREMLIVAPHDLTQNAAFSNMHLVSCRNVLIYMQPQLQQQVIRLLHFSLVPQGILMLGSSETVADLSGEFEALEGKWKVYRKVRDVYLPIRSTSHPPIYNTTPPSSRNPSRPVQFDRLLGEIYQTCFDGKQLTCVLVNASNQLLHIYADSDQLLELPLGDLRANVTDLVPDQLKIPLGTALHRARREGKLVYYSNITLSRQDQEWVANLKVKPCPGGEGSQFIVIMELNSPRDERPDALPSELDSETLQRISELEFELQQTRENLQATLEELGTSNEEQQAINEELLASNEELQSTNEELQSVNEELQTLNTDYEAKILELTQLNSDVDNLLRSTRIGVLFLDNQLNIRKFTPATTLAINIISTDTNRPLTDLTHNLECPDLIELLQQVIVSGRSVERRVIVRRTQDYLLMRINPYINVTGDQDGVVVIFVEINELHAVENQLQQLNRTLENLFDSSPVGLALMDSNLIMIRINKVLADINGLSVEEHLGQRGPDLTPELKEIVEPILQEVIDTRTVRPNMEIRGRTPADPDQDHYWLCSYFPIELEGGNCGVGAAVTDITDLKQAENSLRQNEDRLQQLNRLKDDFLSTVSHELRSPLSNVRMALQMMNLANTEDKIQKYYAVAMRECERQIELVNDLLDLQRLEAETYETRILPLDLELELAQIFEPVELKLGDQSLQKDLDLSEDLFYSDRSCLQRIVGELLHNAVKYTARDGSICFRVLQTQQEVFEFEIANTGDIPEAELPHLFDKFYRVPGSDRWKQGGTGLGLSLVKQMVVALEGSISVTCSEGWIRFHVRLPNHRPPPLVPPVPELEAEEEDQR